MEDWKIVEIYNTTVAVTKEGHIKVLKNKKYVDRQWRLNHDGYPVVSITGYDNNGNKIYRSICVHILVAKAFVPNPYNKPEVNHKDYNRTNPHADNLEWVTHKENIYYSYKVGHYKGKLGKENPNYGNNILSERYAKDKELSKQKQGRKGGANGKSKPCKLVHEEDGVIGMYSYQREAVKVLIDREGLKSPKYPETIIRALRSKGYKKYHLETI